MTTYRAAPDSSAEVLAGAGSGPGERLRRLQRRRRLLREEFLAVVFLLIVLAATVAVLAAQWLGAGSSTNASGAPGPSVVMSTILGGST